ncbi:hypothetical protein JoomaDRAFT_0200 [Galbibacter orientalis DSM 19592]|uniref:Uncharacterized protein n=1 Tax=Galbibacter orientalis DSM 19592 TaxID=926559 RepID=I3C0W7_9FLAO|nr:hypothetical protein JoomaDRAFT_0200 [Galbibacter orientalis DSM 19592]
MGKNCYEKEKINTRLEPVLLQRYIFLYNTKVKL